MALLAFWASFHVFAQQFSGSTSPGVSSTKRNIVKSKKMAQL